MRGGRGEAANRIKLDQWMMRPTGSLRSDLASRDLPALAEGGHRGRGRARHRRGGRRS